MKTKIKIIAIVLIVIIIMYNAVFIMPVNVDMVLLAEVESSKVLRPPIWWAQLDAEELEDYQFVDETARDLMRNYSLVYGNLVISWGRPLELLTYQRKHYLDLKPIIIPGIPRFSSVDTPTTIYIYGTTNAKNMRLRCSPFLDKKALEAYDSLSK
jgi:uncharacterized membrane protein